MHGESITESWLNLSQRRRQRYCTGEATSRWSRVSLEPIFNRIGRHISQV